MKISSEINYYLFFYPTSRCRKLRCVSRRKKVDAEVNSVSEEEFQIAAVIKDPGFWSGRSNIYSHSLEYPNEIRSFAGELFYCMKDEIDPDEMPGRNSTAYLNEDDWADLNSAFLDAYGKDVDLKWDNSGSQPSIRTL